MSFGLTITEYTGQAGGINTAQNRIRRIILLGTSTTAVAADQNKLIEISNLRQFETKFGASSPSYAAVRYIFEQDTQALLWFVCGKDPGATPTLLQNLQFGVSSLSAIQNVESCAAISVEAILQTTQADRTTMFTALENFANNARRKHVNFWNTALATNTKALALTERALYVSNTGASSLYYEYFVDQNNANIPLALHAAVMLCEQSKDGKPFEPPSGFRYAPANTKGVRNNNFVTVESDYNDFQNSQINVPIQDFSGAYYIWGARTLSVDARFINVNTKIAAIATANLLRDVAAPFLQSANDPRGEQGRALQRALYSALDTLFDLGAYTTDEKGDRNKSYKVVINRTQSGTKRITKAIVYAWLVETTEQILIDLYFNDGVPF